MKVKVIYSPVQLDRAVELLADTSVDYKNQPDKFRHSIQKSIQEMVNLFPQLLAFGTLGYYIRAYDIQVEGIDYDENSMKIEIYVDPAVSLHFPTKEEIYSKHHES